MLRFKLPLGCCKLHAVLLAATPALHSIQQLQEYDQALKSAESRHKLHNFSRSHFDTVLLITNSGLLLLLILCLLNSCSGNCC